MLWILYLLFFAGAAMLSTRIAPTAQGSGIPEMKAILSGMFVIISFYPVLWGGGVCVCVEIGRAHV